ncbi:MAG: putative rane protein [Acidobacteria bacterium]|nr:putative rane protein [Acidobacteriota bacterium]
MGEEILQGKTHPDQSRLRRYLPLLIWMAVIFFASTGEFSASNTNALIQPLLRWLFPHITDERIATFHFLLRKCGHFSEYAVMGLLAAHAFIASSHTKLRSHWFVVALLLICVYALSDEYHQSFVASRTASIYDSLIDTAGGTTALILVALWRRRSRRKHELTQQVSAGKPRVA